QDRDWIFKLEPAQIDRTGFDRERGAVLVQDADTDRCLAGGAQIRLPDQFPTRDVLLPTVTRYQEFTLDFETHARSSPRSNPGAGRHKIGCDVFMTSCAIELPKQRDESKRVHRALLRTLRPLAHCMG